MSTAVVADVTMEPVAAQEPQPATKKMKIQEDLTLWHATQGFCTKWSVDTCAIGVRNIAAVFHMLAKLVATGFTTSRPKFLDYFPTDERWFNYTGRFLGLYVRNTNHEGHALRIAPAAAELLAKGLDGVKVTTLSTADGPDAWANTINADCNTATKEKIPKIVAGADLADPKFQVCALAAEFIKGKFAVEFRGETEEDAPFYGISGDDTTAVGTCHMMKHKDLEDAGGGTLMWRGNTCKAALLPTKTSDGEPTDFYIVAVLPNPDEATLTSKQTKPESLDAAFEEIKENAAGLRQVVREKQVSRTLVELPRLEMRMAPADITNTCHELLPDQLMKELDYLTEEDFPEKGWIKSPMHVDKVFHATYIKVNETGFEAAAATAVICFRSLGADTGSPPEIVRFNRGFLLYIMDLGDTPHVLYHSRVESDVGLKDAPAAPPAESE